MRLSFGDEWGNFVFNYSFPFPHLNPIQSSRWIRSLLSLPFLFK